jgi:hypothetical protein
MEFSKGNGPRVKYTIGFRYKQRISRFIGMNLLVQRSMV